LVPKALGTSRHPAVFAQNSLQVTPSMQDTDNNNRFISDKVINANCLETRYNPRPHAIKSRVVEMTRRSSQRGLRDGGQGLSYPHKKALADIVTTGIGVISQLLKDIRASRRFNDQFH
jgi:hypothetical protein